MSWTCYLAGCGRLWWISSSSKQGSDCNGYNQLAWPSGPDVQVVNMLWLLPLNSQCRVNCAVCITPGKVPTPDINTFTSFNISEWQTRVKAWFRNNNPQPGVSGVVILVFDHMRCVVCSTQLGCVNANAPVSCFTYNQPYRVDCDLHRNENNMDRTYVM